MTDLIPESTNDHECPKCGSRILHIDALIVTSAMVEFSGDGEDHELLDESQGSVVWDENSTAVCHRCDHSAPLHEMVAP